MSRTEDIDNGIWSDPDFEELSPDATLLYLWSWTNPRCGMAGIYKVSHRTMSHECKVAQQAVPDALEELSTAGMLFYEQNVLWVRARVKRLRARSPQMAKAVVKDLRNVPDTHPLKARFVDTYGAAPWLKDALSETYAEGIDRVSENPISKGNPDTVSGPSPDGPGTGQGTGQGDREEEGTTEQREGSPLPDDFPDELRPHLRVVWRVLTKLAERHRSKAVTPAALANVVMARQHKPLVMAAYDCAAHWNDRKQPLKDPVAAYRNWLDRTDDLAGFEPLDDKGMPCGAPAVIGARADTQDFGRFDRAAKAKREAREQQRRDEQLGDAA